MQSDIDAQLTNFYEEAPPREFATVMSRSRQAMPTWSMRVSSGSTISSYKTHWVSLQHE